MGCSLLTEPIGKFNWSYRIIHIIWRCTAHNVSTDKDGRSCRGDLIIDDHSDGGIKLSDDDDSSR